VEFETVNYFEQPLSADALKKLLRNAGLKPQEAVRMNEKAYGKLVRGRDLKDDELIRVMAEHPELIQRPFVVRGNKVVLARPTERLSAVM